jgi:plasmid maintenance system antidote protein VapI
MRIERPADGWNVQRVTTHPGEMLREEFMNPWA